MLLHSIAARAYRSACGSLARDRATILVRPAAHASAPARPGQPHSVDPLRSRRRTALPTSRTPHARNYACFPGRGEIGRMPRGCPRLTECGSSRLHASGVRPDEQSSRTGGPEPQRGRRIARRAWRPKAQPRVAYRSARLLDADDRRGPANYPRGRNVPPARDRYRAGGDPGP